LEYRYIVFDFESRDIKGIMRNKPDISEHYIEIEYEKIVDFIEGKLSTADFYIDRTESGTFHLARKRINMLVNSIDERLYKIPKNVQNPDLLVENNRKQSQLTIKLNSAFRSYLLEKHGIKDDKQFANLNIQGTARLDFLLCYDNDPHNRILFVALPIVELLKNKEMIINYPTNNKENHCVLTRRVYNDYCYKEIE